MAEFTLKIRRYDPESGEAAVLGRAHGRPRAAPLGARGHAAGQGALRRLDRHALLVPRRDLRLVRRADQRQARRSPATRTSTPRRRRAEDGVIDVEPMGNMPVIKDLIVDMDAVHWKKIQRVTPWLIDKEPIPSASTSSRREAMIDVTQSMACIQCGACVSDCLSMEVDPLFIGPAALAKAYRFVGDPRDAQHSERLQRPRRGPARHVRLHALLQVHRGLPEGRGADEPDHAPAPVARRTTTASRTATTATATSTRSSRNIERQRAAARGRAAARLLRRRLVPSPRAVPELVGSLPAITKALMRRQGDSEEGAAAPAQGARASSEIFERIETQRQRDELNLYINGCDEDAPRPAPRPLATQPAADEPATTRRSPTDEGRLLARLRQPRLHPGAARLDGAGRAAARTSSWSSWTAPTAPAPA